MISSEKSSVNLVILFLFENLLCDSSSELLVQMMGKARYIFKGKKKGRRKNYLVHQFISSFFYHYMYLFCRFSGSIL